MRGNLYRLTDAQSFIEVAMSKIREEVVQHEECGDRIFVERIDKEFPRDFVIYELLNSQYGFKGDVTENLCKALQSGQSGKRFYSRDYVACIDRGDIVVAPVSDDDDCEITIERDDLRSYCGNSVLYYNHTDIDNVSEYNMPSNIALIDEDKLKYPLTLRRWREGDSFIPFGMAGRKKVSDLLTDLKISRVEKSRQFVLLSEGEIVWVVGHRTDDRFRIGERTENILKITKENI